MIWFLIFCTASATENDHGNDHWHSVCIAPTPMPNLATCNAVGAAMIEAGRNSEREVVRCVQARK